MFTATSCSSGYYSLGGVENCIPCPAGNECSDSSLAPVECTSGTYANNASIACTSCDAGYKCPSNGLGEQIACPTGWYQTNTGQTSCTQCGQGGWGILPSCCKKLLPVDTKLAILKTYYR